MSRMTLAAALTVMAMATAPIAYAQTPAPRPDNPTTTSKTVTNPASDSATTAASTTTPEAAPTQIGPNEMRAGKIIGSTVYDAQNKDVGSVKDIVFDNDGKVSAVVLDVGSFLGMGGKYIAVKVSDLRNVNQRLTVDLTKDQLKQAQAYQLENKEVGSGGSRMPARGDTKRP